MQWCVFLKPSRPDCSGVSFTLYLHAVSKTKMAVWVSATKSTFSHNWGRLKRGLFLLQLISESDTHYLHLHVWNLINWPYLLDMGNVFFDPDNQGLNWVLWGPQSHLKCLHCKSKILGSSFCFWKHHEWSWLLNSFCLWEMSFTQTLCESWFCSL